MRNTIFKLIFFVFPYLIPSVSKSQDSNAESTLQLAQHDDSSTSNNRVTAEILGTIVWLGITNNWNDPQNWFLNSYPNYGVPTFNTDVLIPIVASGNYPILAKSHVGSCNHLTISEGGASLTINNGGDLNCVGDIINNGTINNQGKLNLMGIGSQNFPGPGLITYMSILQISKGAGAAILNRDLFIDSALLPTSGVLALGNYDITLRSGASRTAYVGTVGSSIGFTYGSGRFIVQRYIAKTRKWQLLSTPTNSSQTIFDAWQDGGSSTVSPSGYGVQITAPSVVNGIDAYSPGYSMKSQVGCTSNFTSVATTYNPILNPKGYFLYVYGDRAATANGAAGSATTLQTRGKLFVGNQVAGDHPSAVTGTANLLTADDHLSVGNPFAAAINFASLYNLSANSSGNFKANFKVWDPSQDGLYGSGLYQTITGPTGWLATPGGGTIYNTSSNFSDIQSGQAFYVEASNSGTVSVNFSESIKSFQNRLVNRNGNNEREIDPTQLSMLSAFIYASSGKLLDGNRAVFGSAFSNLVDGDDASKLWNPDANFAILKSMKSLAVETMTWPANEDSIQYEFYGLDAGQYKLVIVPQRLTAENWEAMLVDKFLNRQFPVNLNDSTIHSFFITADLQSSAPERFYLILKKKPAPLQFKWVNAGWKPSEKVGIAWEVSNIEQASYFQVERSSNTGDFQEIGPQVSANGDTYSAVYEPMTNEAIQYYRIKAVSANAEIIYSDIVALTKNSGGKILVAPNPVQHKNLQLILQDFTNGKYYIQIHSLTGALIYNANVKIGSYQSRQMIILPLGIATGNYQVTMLDEFGIKVGGKKIVVH